MRESLYHIAIKVERALSNTPLKTVLRGDGNKPLVAMAGNRAAVMVHGTVTAEDVYELATAVLYYKLERKGKAS